MTFTAHKTYGPKGIGALYVCRKPRVRIEAQMHGGGHERGLRSGTLPTHQIVGMGEAFRLAKVEMDSEIARIKALRDRLAKGLQEIEETYINGDMEHRVPHNLNVSFNYVEGESLIMASRTWPCRPVRPAPRPAGTVLRAARPGPQRRTGAQLDPFHHRPLHHRRRHRLRHRTDEVQGRQAARTVAAVGHVQRRHRHQFDPWAAH
jgi:hypothetical protein